jgi:citrate lyase gamma subunit
LPTFTGQEAEGLIGCRIHVKQEQISIRVTAYVEDQFSHHEDDIVLHWIVETVRRDVQTLPAIRLALWARKTEAVQLRNELIIRIVSPSL